MPSALEPRPLPQPLLEAFFDDQLAGSPKPATAVHPDDEMLDFLTAAHGGDPDQGLLAYFSTGLSIARVYRRILRWRFGELERIERLLDFASGYGRITRYLLRELPPERVWVAEIHPGAVEFQREQWGVHGLVSGPRAEDFANAEHIDDHFDAILVTSLFTHLPDPTFRAWLRRLCELLAPGGILVLSAHDVSLRLANERPPPGELLFNAVSESRALDTQEYGSAWIDETFFRETLEKVDPTLIAHRLPRALLQHQDLYLVLRPDEDTEEGDDMDRDEDGGRGSGGRPGSPTIADLVTDTEPAGYVEGFSLRPGAEEGTLELLAHGWSLDFTGRAPLHGVQLKIDGEPVGESRAFGPRPDVADAHYQPQDRAVGWQVVGRLPGPAPERRSRSRITVLVKALSGPGASREASRTEAAGEETESILFLGTLEGALLRSAQRRIDALEDEVRSVRKRGVLALLRLRHRISAMRSSKFWKLRVLWFQVKKKLGRIDKIWPP